MFCIDTHSAHSACVRYGFAVKKIGMFFLQNLYTGEAMLLRRYFLLQSTRVPSVLIAKPYERGARLPSKKRKPGW